MTRNTRNRLFSAVALPAVAAGLIAAAAGVWLHGASPVFAPEPARLTSTLYSSGASTVIYVTTLRQGSAIFLSGSWTPSSAPAGMPCSTTYPVPAGTVLYHVVYASGSYRRCQ
jgi:hypothetical protein